MAEDGFQIFVTVDRNLPYQQDLKRLAITIFVLRAPNNRRATLKALIPKMLARLSEGNLDNVNEIS
jgi:hypothetical protein